MSLLEGTLGKVAVAVVVGMVVTTVGAGAALATGVVSPEAPTVESIDNEWGEITNETTGIETRVVVDNPNRFGIPGVAGVSYDVAMNDVTVASGDSGRLAIPPGRNEVDLRTAIDNGKIPAWWASHINNGEETTVSVRPSLDAPLLSRDLPSQDRTFETDMLASFDSESGESVTAGDRTLLTVEETDASWGEATAEETPLRFSGTVTNPNEEAIEFATIGYTVSMNDVTVAEGTTDEAVRIEGESTDAIRVNSTLDNTKLDEWWVSHLRNDEETTLDVRVFAEVETDDGTRRVDLPFMSKRVAFETDILGGGTATTRELDSGGEFDFEAPTVESVERDWTPTDDGTRFVSTVVVDNPNGNESSLGELALDADYRVSLNDVVAVEDGQRAVLDPGRNELEFENTLDDETIQRWWASHVNEGEETTLRTESDVTADLGFAEVPVELPDSTQTFETDMLGGLDGTEQSVEFRGYRIATIQNASSEWGEATTDRSPMDFEADVTNERAEPLTVERFGYNVTANDVVLADNESEVGTTIPGKTTRGIEATGYLENDRIPEWWVEHLSNGERSTVSVSYYVVVEYAGQEFTVELDEMSYERTVETDAFGGE
ncbi:LEA type 2 family protein [Halorussus salilacus]|uniref:LEA type 2 family protein n=1 Tax=Halorussus salilacus TaxID=2953750 RepID=UPI00209D17AD|nr:LEA type 2 family protein [Halorussus salilacus]USZ67620.1 LEA type 2 family protein [Halorussus salilacus]